MPLTKDDIHALRNADDLVVHLSNNNPNGLVRLIKRKGLYAKPFETDQEHILDVPVKCGHARIALIKCFAMVSIYHSQHTVASMLLKTLRVGDEIEFHFKADSHTNGYLARHGLHADSLAMNVWRGGVTIGHWTLQSGACPNNSARMVQGVPDSDTYKTMAKEAENL